MAKKQKGTPRTTLEEVNESLSTAAQRIEANKKYIYYALIAIAAIVLLVMGYIYGIRNPNLQKAKDGIGKADMTYLQGDTTNALKEYEKVFVPKGGSVDVKVHLDLRSFAFFDVTHHDWAVDSGTYRIEIGKSSADIVLSAEVTL